MPPVPSRGAADARSNLRRLPTKLALTGVILATAILTITVSITYGHDSILRKWLQKITPHAVVLPERTVPLVPQQLFKLDNAVVELVVNTPPSDRHEIKPRVEVATRARRSSRLIESIAPVVTLSGIVRNGARFRAVNVHGVDPRLEFDVESISRTRPGAFASLQSDSHNTVIGRGLAARLGVSRGRRVTLIAPSGAIRQLTVVDVFDSDLLSLENDRAYINIELAQSLRGTPRNAVTGLSIAARDPDDAARVAASVERAIGFRTQTWEQVNAATLSSHRNRMIVAWLLAGSLVLLAAVSMANAQLASLLLPVPGYGERVRVVTFASLVRQGMVLGTIGGISGAALGVGAVVLIEQSGYIAPSFIDSVLRFHKTQVSFAPPVYIAPALVAFVLVSAASLIPALRAHRRRHIVIQNAGRGLE